MALLAWDGFDHYNDTVDISTRLDSMLQWTNSGGLLDGNIVPGRNGNGKAWAGDLIAVLGQRIASAFFGVSAFTQYGDLIFRFRDSVTNVVQCTVWFLSRNFSIQVWQGNPFAGFGDPTPHLLYTSPNNIWSSRSYFYIEIWPVIDPIIGSVTVRIDQITKITLTNVTTQQSANSWWDTVEMTGIGIVPVWDDFYYADDTTGPGPNPCNTFLGDLRSYSLFPTANTSVQFTPLANTNWQEVSEVNFDGDVSYNYDSTVGHEDRFSLTQVPSTISNILGLSVTTAARKDDAGSRSIANALKSGGTEVYGTTYVLPDGYAYFTDRWNLDPSSAVWTLSSVNAVEAGYKMAA